jgi:hypothetical protein
VERAKNFHADAACGDDRGDDDDDDERKDGPEMADSSDASLEEWRPSWSSLRGV